MQLHKASELVGGGLLLLGAACVGALLRDQYDFGGTRLPQYAFSLIFLGGVLWSIGRSGPRDDR